MPAFFIPNVDPEKQEERYRELAHNVGAVAADPARRIYSMTWKHDGVVWTATVGEQIRGIATIVKGRGRDKTYREVPRSTNETVWAIFAHVPFLIAHDGAGRYWNWPILAGEPSRIVYFDA